MWFFERPHTLVVNEYVSGQGMNFHIDSAEWIGETIAIVSLGTAWEMTLKQMKKSVLDTRTMLLEPGSVLIFKGEARHQWEHGILPQNRDRRVSLVFRNARGK